MVRLLADLFPAEVTLPTGRVYRRARVIIAPGETVVLAEQHGTKDLVVHRASHTAPPDLTAQLQMKRTRGTIHGTDGEVYVRQTGSCRCHGQRLLAVDPEAVLS